jgi:hypothetical protein
LDLGRGEASLLGHQDQVRQRWLLQFMPDRAVVRFDGFPLYSEHRGDLFVQPRHFDA